MASRKDYEHRKLWLTDRIHQLAKCFAVAVDAYAIMSNHFHLVVYYDPQESYRWSDEEVADRWLSAFPPRIKTNGATADQRAILALHRTILLQLPQRLLHARQTLGSLSMFMKHLKQPVAYRANREDKCTGHFFEGRFYSGALLDESAVIAAMVYVDLNPIRAQIANEIEDYKAASGYKRSKLALNTPDRLEQAVEPLVSGLTKERPKTAITLGQYLVILASVQGDYQTPKADDKKSRWFDRITSLRKRQRAFGSILALSDWCAERGWSVSGSPLPVI